jgi:hypothetical protein
MFLGLCDGGSGNVTCRWDTLQVVEDWVQLDGTLVIDTHPSLVSALVTLIEALL